MIEKVAYSAGRLHRRFPADEGDRIGLNSRTGGLAAAASELRFNERKNLLPSELIRKYENDSSGSIPHAIRIR
jgi:hypothetical protein